MRVYIPEDEPYFFTFFRKDVSNPHEADLVITKCENLKEFVLDNNKVIYCYTEKAKLRRIDLLGDNMYVIVTNEMIKQVSRNVIGVLTPDYVKLKEGKKDIEILFPYKITGINQYYVNYVDSYPVRNVIHSIVISHSRFDYYARSRFVLYLNRSVVSDDFYLYEAMVHGAIPITWKDVPGVKIDIDGEIEYLDYKLVEISKKNVYDAIERALHMTRDEYIELEAKVRNYVKEKRTMSEVLNEITEKLIRVEKINLLAYFQSPGKNLPNSPLTALAPGMNLNTNAIIPAIAPITTANTTMFPKRLPNG